MRHGSLSNWAKMSRKPRVLGSIVAFLVCLLMLGGLALGGQDASLSPRPVSAQTGGWDILYTLPDRNQLWSIDMLSENDGWVAGGWCCDPWYSTVLNWQGSTWQEAVDAAGYQLFAVDMVNSDEGWFGGQFGELEHYFNGSWQRISSPTSVGIQDIEMISSSEGWAVGGSGYPDYNGVILHYTGGTWGVDSNLSSQNLNAIDMTSNGDGWVVGGAGPPDYESLLYHYDGSSWVKVNSPTDEWLEDVDMVSGDEGWAVGHRGVILHYLNGSWETVTSPVGTLALYGLDMISNNEGWAVGEQGTIVHYLDGVWLSEDSPTSATLNHVDMLSNNDGWAVGVTSGTPWNGMILRYTGTACSAPPIEDLSFNPESPSAVGTTVRIHAKATWDSCFRAMRLKIDESVVYELGAPEFTWDWTTSEHGAGDHSIRLEVAAQGDDSWARPSVQTATYHLSGGICEPDWDLFCGGSDSWNNGDFGSTDQIDNYSCSAWRESGPEYAYSFIPGASGQVAVALSGMSDDLDLFVLDGDSCNASDCVTYGDTTVTFGAESGHSYYLVVDGYWDAVSDYTITVICSGATCSAPSLNSPGDGYVHTSVNRTINFAWSAPPDCTPDGYTFRVKTVPDMDWGGATVFDESLGGTQVTKQFGSQWDGMELYWSVRACKPCSPYSPGAWAPSRQFRCSPSSPQPTVDLSSTTFGANENAGSAPITVTLSAASDQTVTVDYATSNGTATAGEDYTTTSGTLTFNPGMTSQSFSIPVINDTLDEDGETVTLTLSNPVNATMGANSPGTMTVVDDDEPAMTRPWTFMLYLDGDNNLYYHLDRAITNLEAQPGNPDVNVVVLWDADRRNDSWRFLVQPGGNYTLGLNRWYMGELNMGDPQTLSDFFVWAREHYPADNYYLAIADHGRGTTGVAWDDTNNKDYLSTVELRTALNTATNSGEWKIDVLHYDACLMAMLENAYQVKDFADYLVASQNLGWSVFAYEQYAQAGEMGIESLPAPYEFADVVAEVTASTTPQGLAADVAEAYFNHPAINNETHPRTISALDLSQVMLVRQAVDNLATALLNNLDGIKTYIQHTRSATQKFDSRDYTKITDEDEYLDVYHLAARLKQYVPDSGVQTAAQGLMDAVAGGFVVVEYHQSGAWGGEEQFYWDLDNAHGVSIYFPPRSGSSDFNHYVTHQVSRFTVESGWDEFLKDYFGEIALPPDPWGDPGLPPMGTPELKVYLPLVSKRW